MISQKKILVVEDNKINRIMLKEILDSQYQVLEAENGLEALAVLEEYQEEISLILLDIVMPVMDGYTFLAKMKANPAYASVPVIVTTQNDDESNEVAALSNGATDFVAKPYKPQIILHRVASIINLRETAAIINQFQYDQLTGLYSKEFFYKRAKDILMQNPENDYDIICSDIENFKLINDVFGIPAGDRLLCDVAGLYTELAGAQGICGRLNADKFVCLLERRRKYRDEMFMQMGTKIGNAVGAKNIVVKWGVYAITDRTISVEQMCDRALLAACSIKGRYGKHFALYDDKLRNKLLREHEIEDEMESALAEGQFIVYLQAKYRIEDDTLAGAEALIRWNHPKWGIQSPGEFIPLFERNGFITKLDQYVWDRACAMMREWDDQGFAPISISVNVSRADIYNEDIAGILLKIVQKYHLQPSRLHLEITESAYTEKPSQIIDTVKQLRELGFIIEMDDFGSGYSSLNMLNQMPLDILKLDMKFIQSETSKPAQQGILRFIIGLARWMKLSVVAEGVETREQLERLRGLGCDYAQGYYYAKPVPYEEFESLMEQHHEPVKQQVILEGGTYQGQPEQALLIVDEDTAYRDKVRKTFEDRFKVVEAADSESALNCITTHGNRIGAAMISLTLPEEGGFSVLEVLGRERSIWKVPVIATAPPDEELEEKALDLGVDDITSKPHSQRMLRKRVSRVIEIAAAQEREKTLQQEAYRDYLTGLLNRRGFSAALNDLGEKDVPMAVYLFDVDNLKRINDTWGHMEGDEVIKEFGALLHSHTRTTDILARFGGDEFVVVMRKMKSSEDMLKKGQEICASFQKGYLGKNNQVGCTAGVAVWNNETSVEEIISRADRALYHAKTRKKGGCCLWKG